MKILVCVKAVPSSTEVRFDPVTHTIIRDGKQAVINPFDASALECAVQIRQARGAEENQDARESETTQSGPEARVAVLSMGIPDTVRLLRDCLARGADDALLLSDRAFAGADTLATSYSLACAIRKMGLPDLIICGKMAVDGDTAQIGPELAAALDIPAVTGVKQVIDVSEDTVTVLRESDSGDERVTVYRSNDVDRECSAVLRKNAAVCGGETVKKLRPVLLTVAREAASPRMPSIAGIRAAKDKNISVYTAADIGADPERTGLKGSPTQVVRTFSPEKKKECVMIGGSVAEQAAAIGRILQEEL